MTMITENLTPAASMREAVRYIRQVAEITQQQAIERAREMERIRGIKDMVYRVPPFPTATSLVIRGQNIPVDQGYSWNLKMITGVLSASDSVAAFMGEDANGYLIGYVPAPGAAPAQNVFQMTWTSSQKVLKAGESIFLRTSGTGNLSNVTVFGVQIPAEELGKIIS